MWTPLSPDLKGGLRIGKFNLATIQSTATSDRCWKRCAFPSVPRLSFSLRPASRFRSSRRLLPDPSTTTTTCYVGQVHNAKFLEFVHLIRVKAPSCTCWMNIKTFVTGQESPSNERWGGWYVTAVHGADDAIGNATASNSEHPDQLDKPRNPKHHQSECLIQPGPYLTGSSDIVALLILAHQTQMHNLITQTT